MASWLIRGLTVALAVGASTCALADRASERERFMQGWQAAGRADHAAVRQAIAALPDYPLTPYLEYELKRQTLNQIPSAEMSRFLARYRDWSFGAALETRWLRSLGERGDYELLGRYGRDSADTEVRCWLARADIAAGRSEGLSERIARLWLVGRSQSSTCDPAFEWWRRQGHPSTDQAWRRFRLALDSGETGLARYLRRYLDQEQRAWADHWLEVRARPGRLISLARLWPDREQSRQLVADTLTRMARRDWQEAERAWQVLRNRFDFPPATIAAVEREIALFRAVALDSRAVAAIDALPERALDQQMLEWRARSAMAQGEWEEVLASIQRMRLIEQGQSRWRYWRGRALAELGRAEAMLAFGSLAGEATYYGFLAATWLQQDLSLCPQDLAADPARQRRLMRDAEFERAIELFEVGLFNHARRTWSSVWRRLSEDERHQAALLAAGRGWHDRAIAALGASGLMRAYPWRFPLIEIGRVSEHAARREVDPALVYGLMRAESAMQPDALSPAGARGLLQLMPGTAQAVARRHGLPFNGAADLMDPAINIPLGIAHLGELQRRYEGDWIRVAAAYNAGANAVARWLEERPDSDPDVWLETLPFFETRDYVPRVLAFATIYEWQLERSPTVLARSVLPQQVNGAATFQCSE
ncbi:transglycosylase SLT domain-containing protein [Wenzhouxiangella limi]|uniref:Transglycosylase SLT domain-containing protein n=1 Tax=Wenzhouxiangella limi TaxID=2707351 RepID=A0A845VF22_9GAMM|nr:transglycosylase SLT domain-containing protein [Wenzhouxiangella limi]NDY95829.1 transglycosylase SLT domain-containing protein [Wenzhouxiangella limi]